MPLTNRVAQCRCGNLTAACFGAPLRVSICHCLACQKRTGSAFGAQARFRSSQVVIKGRHTTWVREADSGLRAYYKFCPSCGSTIAYQNEGSDDLTAIPLGAFGETPFPAPQYSVYERRKCAWTLIIGGDVHHEY
jgi:hypothetical protein